MAGERVQRRPAAIVVADVAGYSRLMREDARSRHSRSIDKQVGLYAD